MCALISPGCISRSRASIAIASAGPARPGGPTSAMVSPTIRMSAASARCLPALMTRPPRMIVARVSAIATSHGLLVGVDRPGKEHLLDNDDRLKQNNTEQRQQHQRAPGERDLKERR